MRQILGRDPLDMQQLFFLKREQIGAFKNRVFGAMATFGCDIEMCCKD